MNKHVVLLSLILLAPLIECSEDPQHNVITEGTTVLDKTERVEIAAEKKPTEFSGQCFHASIEDMCHNKSLTGSSCCERHSEFTNSIYCCNVQNIDKSLSCLGPNLSNFSHIHIINATQTVLNVSKSAFKHFNSLVITDGKIQSIVGDFYKFSNLKCLNFSSNNISEINARAFIHLVYLSLLDLSSNNLTTIPTLPPSSNAKIDVKNNPISCKSISDAIEINVEFLNKETSFCETTTTYVWFNDTASISVSQLEKMRQLENDCPKIGGRNCSCEPEQMYYSKIEGEKNSLIFNARVDCSGLNLTSLPEKIPENTISLNVSNNMIESLSKFQNNSHYQNVKSLFADNNLIKSLLDLEGTPFLENFMQLSLRNNKITSIPIYFLSNTIERNQNGKLLYLGGNYLNCDCLTAKSKRLWQHITDWEKIMCANMPKKIFELEEARMCKSSHDWANYVDYLIIIEIILLVALITKVSYDWYVFRNSGFLPNPASWIILYNHK